MKKCLAPMKVSAGVRLWEQPERAGNVQGLTPALGAIAQPNIKTAPASLVGDHPEDDAGLVGARHL